LINLESDMTRGVTASMFVDTAYGQPLTKSDESWVQKIFTNSINLTVGEGGAGSVIVLSLNIIMGILVGFQMFMRIITLDLVLILAPLWTFCLFFKPWRMIGSVGLRVFAVTLFVQVLQVISMDMGSILIENVSNLGLVPNNEMAPLISVGLGTMSYYLTFKIPGMTYMIFQAGGSNAPMTLINSQAMNVAKQSWTNVKNTAGTVNAARGAVAGGRSAAPAARRAMQRGLGLGGAVRMVGRAAMRGARKSEDNGKKP
jgi:hypothetical protein